MVTEKSTIKIKPGSPKGFGVVFTIAFLLIALHPVIHGSSPRLWAFVPSFGFLAITFLKQILFEKPNYWWFRFGMLLSIVVSPLIMGLVYCLTVLPTAVVLKSIKKDPLKMKVDHSAKSYWIERDDDPQPMKRQF